MYPAKKNLLLLFFVWSILLIIQTHSWAQFLGNKEKIFAKFNERSKKDSTYAFYSKYIITQAEKALKHQPNPIKYISTAGRLKGDSLREKTIKSTKDFEKIWHLVFAYQITQNQKYLSHATLFLVEWSGINEASGEPINETKLEPLIEAYQAIREVIPTSQKSKIDQWLGSIAEAEIKSEILSFKKYNNIHAHRTKIVGMIGFCLSNETWINYAEENLELLIKKNLLSNGQTKDFIERDALHYHCYTLEPMIKLAILFHQFRKKDYYFYLHPISQSSLSKSVNFILPYISKKQVHKEFVHSKVAFDKARSDNQQNDYIISKNFDINKAQNLLELASYFDQNLINKYKKHFDNYNKNCSRQKIINQLLLLDSQ